jgi:hypothetical protein
LRCLNLGGQFGGGGGRHNRGGARILVASPWGYGLCEELIGRLRLVFGECIWKAYYVQYYSTTARACSWVLALIHWFFGFSSGFASISPQRGTKVQYHVSLRLQVPLAIHSYLRIRSCPRRPDSGFPTPTYSATGPQTLKIYILQYRGEERRDERLATLGTRSFDKDYGVLPVLVPSSMDLE